jgi:hypothetical protein
MIRQSGKTLADRSYGPDAPIRAVCVLPLGGGLYQAAALASVGTEAIVFRIWDAIW